MRSKTYPLETLRKIREDRSERAAVALGERVREREESLRQRTQCIEARTQHAGAVSAAKTEERNLLERGALRASDLMQQGVWELRVSEEARVLEERVAKASECERDAVRAEGVARHDLALRKADLEVVLKDRDRFRGAWEREQLLREDEDVEDAWRPRRG